MPRERAGVRGLYEHLDCTQPAPDPRGWCAAMRSAPSITSPRCSRRSPRTSRTWPGTSTWEASTTCWRWRGSTTARCSSRARSARSGRRRRARRTPQDTIQRPTTMYGVTKVAGELLCDYYCRPLRGRHARAAAARADLLRRAARRRHHRLRGRDLPSGDALRPLHLLPRPRYPARHDVHARRDPRDDRADGRPTPSASTTATPTMSPR